MTREANREHDRKKKEKADFLREVIEKEMLRK